MEIDFIVKVCPCWPEVLQALWLSSPVNLLCAPSLCLLFAQLAHPKVERVLSFG